MNERICQEAVAFQPPALAIRRQRLPLPARCGPLGCLLFLAGVLLWAWHSQIDVIVRGDGRVAGASQNVVIKPLERVVIKEILVKPGELVRRDQVLFVFDPDINQSEIERLQHEIDTLSAQYERLQAQFSDQPYAPSGGNAEAGVQEAIFRQKTGFYQQKRQYFRQSIEQVEAAMVSTQEGMRKQQERLELIRQMEGMYQELKQSHAVSLRELLEVEMSRLQMEAEYDKLKNTLVEQGHQRQGVIASENSFVEEWRQNISEEMVKIYRELSSYRKQMEKQQKQLHSYSVLRAPAEAVVHEMAAFSIGSAVREAEALITLVPLEGGVELEVEIAPQDIGRVQVGSPVRIKLNAYPFQKYGTLSGRVRTLSADTFQKTREGGAGVGATYYQARITLDPESRLRRQPASFRLIPGMLVQAEIKTGTRRLIEYLIYPLIKSLDEAGREP